MNEYDTNMALQNDIKNIKLNSDLSPHKNSINATQQQQQNPDHNILNCKCCLSLYHCFKSN